jgi:hypothetical protein
LKEKDATSLDDDEAIALFDDEGQRIHDHRRVETVREGDEVSEVVVCDLVERSYAIAGEISSTSNSRRSPSSP